MENTVKKIQGKNGEYKIVSTSAKPYYECCCCFYKASSEQEIENHMMQHTTVDWIKAYMDQIQELQKCV